MTSLRKPNRFSAIHGLVLVATLSVVLAACGGAAASPSPSTSPLPSAPSSPVPSAPVSPQPSLPSGDPSDPADPGNPAPTPRPIAVIPDDSIAQVVTDGLRVRSKPGVSADSKLLEPLLDNGRLVFVADGPVEASGYTWYFIAPLGLGAGEQDLPVGWVAIADKDGSAWVEERDANCPEKPDTFAEFSELDPYIALACFGDDDLTFDAETIRPEATCGIDLGWTIQPEWLGNTCPQPTYILIGEGAARDHYAVTEPGVEFLGVDPGVERDEAVEVAVTGAFDHPESENCRVERYEPEAGPDPQISREEAVLICRSQFVVTDMQPL
jgi:hypothetical protein